jgi:hypothetical protein
VVANETALAATTARFCAAARLQVAITNKPTVARPAAADGTAIRLAVWVLYKAAVALLGVGGEGAQEAYKPQQCAKVICAHLYCPVLFILLVTDGERHTLK